MNETTCGSNDEVSSTVQKASRFLAKILRHDTDESVTMDSRGWCNVKDVRLVLAEHFDMSGASLLGDILDADEKNRFQIVNTDAGVSFVRATRKHSHPDVDLLNVTPDEAELTWYFYDAVIYSDKSDPQYGTMNDTAWVEATSKEDAVKLLQRRSGLRVDIPDDLSEEHFEATSRDEITEHDLNSKKANYKIHQDGRKALVEFADYNMGGYKGLYFVTQPDRVENRL